MQDEVNSCVGLGFRDCRMFVHAWGWGFHCSADFAR